MRFQRVDLPAILNGQEAARCFFSSCFRPGDDATEQLWVAHVDSAARCLLVESYEGNAHSIEMPVREIIVDAARVGSAAIILAHNHPCGDPSPSRADCNATRKMVSVGHAIDLTVLDHLIFAGGQCSSMRSMGLL